MSILNYGSLNIDLVYRVAAFVRPGETIAAREFCRIPGGKGLNQSLALARAGLAVEHAGKIGSDGMFLKRLLDENQVSTRFVTCDPAVATGHAVIQVDDAGENCIVLYGGANRAIAGEEAASVIAAQPAGGWLLLQNEISAMPEIIRLAAARRMRIFLNPAPLTPDVASYPLELVDKLILNECESAALAGLPPETGDPLPALRKRYPRQNILLTRGARGACHASGNGGAVVTVPAARVEHVVDTTAAGDTFLGYFIAELARNSGIEAALTVASRAAAWCIGRAGAAPSIPFRRDLPVAPWDGSMHCSQ